MFVVKIDAPTSLSLSYRSENLSTKGQILMLPFSLKFPHRFPIDY